ncbi:MAG: hypothetical protein Q9220_001848 [cf. Caloplaca sp. 1 TL-2023]
MSGFTVFFKGSETSSETGKKQPRAEWEEGVGWLIFSITQRATFPKDDPDYEHWQKGIEHFSNAFEIQEAEDAASEVDLSEVIELLIKGFTKCRNYRRCSSDIDLTALFKVLWKAQDAAGIERTVDDPTQPALRSTVDQSFAIRSTPCLSITSPHTSRAAPRVTAEFHYKKTDDDWINAIPFEERFEDIKRMLERRRDLEFQLHNTKQRLKRFYSEFAVMFCQMNDPRPTVPEIMVPIADAYEEYHDRFAPELKEMMMAVRRLTQDGRNGGMALKKWEAEQQGHE